jgi:predicted metal-binding membrane protein
LSAGWAEAGQRPAPFWPLRREQWLLLLCLLLLSGLAWLALLRLSEMMSAPGGMADAAMAGMPMPWGLNEALLMLAMWLVMMVGMMLPSAIPMLLMYQLMLRQRLPTAQRHGAVALFCLAYVLVWGGFSLFATLLQWGLEQLLPLSPQLFNWPHPASGGSATLAAALLLAAGAYQLVPTKSACLEHCRGPLQFLLAYWRPGWRGGWRMGLAHGWYCLGCCWVLMGLLFVGGVMNLLWAALLGGYVLLEKTLPAGRWFSRLAGIVLLGWGGALLLF